MSELKQIALDQIIANQYQPRIEFSDEAIDQLSQSIAENGLLQPITVRQNNDCYEIIAGERRFRACKSLGLTHIDAIVIQSDDVQSAIFAMIENIQREDLSAIEEANGYLQMLRLTGMTQSELAKKVCKTQSSIANKLRLLSLSEDVQNAISSKRISERHGRALLGLNKDQQTQMISIIEKKEYTVKQTEDYVQTHYNAPAKKKNKSRCFGVSTRLIINSVRDTYQKARALSKDVSLKEQETEDSYIMTITIKK